MDLKLGMKLEVIREINCGIRVIPIGEIAEITNIEDNKINIIIKNIGVGIFSINEIEEYFKEYIKREYKGNNNEIERTKLKIKKLKKKLKKLERLELEREIED